ncbi:hypothetical protein PSN45_000872 [Yamadazyma tenuis]|nr:hypothetical protein PSN45_000872 [Yamadazyma tenuis]
MHHMHGVPILQTNLQPLEKQFWDAYNATSYLSVETGNKSAFFTYLATMGLAFVFATPLIMVMKNVQGVTPGYVTALVANTAVVLVGLFNYKLFMSSVPDLYPGNIFGVFNGIYFVTMIAQCIVAVIAAVHARRTAGASYESIDSDVDSLSSPSPTLYDLSRNQSPSSFELDSYPVNSEPHHDLEANDLTVHLNLLKKRPFPALFAKLNDNPWVVRSGAAATTANSVLAWFNFLFFLVYVPTAIAVFGCFGQGNKVFNLLAHFIKGGVFFILGLVTIARYCGAWSHKGWAWNHKLVRERDLRSRWVRLSPKGLITMEWIESFLVFFYGSTNVFLEHLANPGGEWSAKDLEHASIAFIFIGCGLCGLITEAKLSNWRHQYANFDDNKTVIKASPGFSPNPFPILCIFWTGTLMSQHQQASELSTAIHAQWGSLLAYGTFFRFVTYVMTMVLPRPRDLSKPTQPITEIIAGFCLLAGGVIFMESCDPVILALEWRGYGAMFTLNVCLGLVFLLMAWIMSVFQFKTWLQRRAH